MLDIALRDYQQSVVDRVRLAHASGHLAPLVVMPTGAGKTIVGVRLCLDARAEGVRAYFIAPRSTIVEQTSKALDRYSIPHGVVMGSHWRDDPEQLIQVGTTQTLSRRMLAKSAGLVIFDEAHAFHESLVELKKRCVGARFVGLSATPFRLDGRSLGDLFDVVIVGSTLRALIARGHLVPPRAFAPVAPNLSGVPTDRRTGDFETAALARAVDKKALVGDIVEHYRDLGEGLPAVVFAVTVRHSRSIVERFNREGIPAAHIDGSMSRSDRVRIQGCFARETRVLSSCGVLSEGWDCPEACVGILARPTKSLALYIQQVGRILRPSRGKTAGIILDHAGNTLRHGLVTDERSPSLRSFRPKPKVGEPEESDRDGPIRDLVVCPKCSLVQFSTGAPCACGATLPFAVGPRETEGRLVEIESGEPIEFASAEDNEEVWNGLDRAPSLETMSELEKRRLLDSLRTTQAARAFSDAWVSKEYARITGDRVESIQSGGAT